MIFLWTFSVLMRQQIKTFAQCLIFERSVILTDRRRWGSPGVMRQFWPCIGEQKCIPVYRWVFFLCACLILLLFIAESLRKYPPLAFLDRKCKADYKIPGTDIIIEKGIPVYISVSGIQNDEKYVPEPDKFIPERHQKNLNDAQYSYVPFGGGPRACIGNYLRNAFMFFFTNCFEFSWDYFSLADLYVVKQVDKKCPIWTVHKYTWLCPKSI